MLINIRLPNGVIVDIDEMTLIKVTGTQFNPDSVDPHDVATFEEYWIGHPAEGGVQVKRSAVGTIIKGPVLFSDTGDMG